MQFMDAQNTLALGTRAKFLASPARELEPLEGLEQRTKLACKGITPLSVLTINRGKGRLEEVAPDMIQAGDDGESEKQGLGQREVVRFWMCLRYSQDNRVVEWLYNMKWRS